MRRKERKLSTEEINKIIMTQDILRLGLCDNNSPYVVPLNYGYDGEAFYVHCAIEGRKLDIIECNPKVCIEIEGKSELKAGESACSYTMKYESVIGFGTAKILREKQEVIKGLDILMKQFSNESFTYPEKVLEKVAIIKIDIDEITGKASK